MLRAQVKALSAATASATFTQALLSMDSFVTSDLVRYMADAAMMKTVSNLTRRRKAKRLQDGIDRYVSISRQDRRTVTRSATTLPGPRLRTASAVDRCKGSRGAGTTPRRRKVREQSTALMEMDRAHRRTTTGRLRGFDRQDSRCLRVRSEKMPAACEVRR